MDALEGRWPQRWILHSSISSTLGGLGLAAYAGANAMLDALALQRGPTWLSIDWDAWDNAAEAQSASMPSAIKPAEGNEVLLRLMGQWEGSRALVAIQSGRASKGVGSTRRSQEGRKGWDGSASATESHDGVC